MRPISDALELLTAQHEEIDFLVVQVQQTYDADAFDELTDKLVQHLALEQELFYPAITEATTDEVQVEMVAEHVAIKHVLADLVWLGVEDGLFGTKLHELADLLEGHCGYQEDLLFETVAETLTEQELAALGTDLRNFGIEVRLAA